MSHQRRKLRQNPPGVESSFGSGSGRADASTTVVWSPSLWLTEFLEEEEEDVYEARADIYTLDGEKRMRKINASLEIED